MKKIIGIVCIVCLGLVAIIGIVCWSSKTVKFSGHIAENGTTAEGDILVEHKRYNSLFGWCLRPCCATGLAPAACTWPGWPCWSAR